MSVPLELSVGLVDDEPLSLNYLAGLVSGASGVTITGTWRNGREALAGLQQSPVDLLFLDIQMPGLDGFDVVQKLQSDVMPLLVFATAYDEFAVRAFEHNAVDYILKPFDGDRVSEAVERARERLALTRLAQEQLSDDSGGPDYKAVAIDALARLNGRELPAANSAPSSMGAEIGRLPIRDGQHTELVEFNAIDWIDAAGDYMCVHAAGQTHILRSTMKELQERLSDNFARIHRSTIVNLNSVVAVDSLPKGEARLNLNNGHALKVSRNYRVAVQHLLS